MTTSYLTIALSCITGLHAHGLGRGVLALAPTGGSSLPSFSLVSLWGSMGLFAKLIVLAMAVMSVASVVVISERLMFFARSRRESVAYASSAGALLAAGKVAEAAGAKVDLEKAGYLGRTLRAGLSSYASGDALDVDTRIESVARALERQGLRETQSLKHGLGLLASVASSSPFVGLLGTVMGIVTAFQNMAASGSGGLASVSAGIAEALVTTAFGLLVAIPSLLAYNYLQGWVDERAVDISEASNELLDAVARSLRTRAG